MQFILNEEEYNARLSAAETQRREVEIQTRLMKASLLMCDRCMAALRPFLSQVQNTALTISLKEAVTEFYRAAGLNESGAETVLKEYERARRERESKAL